MPWIESHQALGRHPKTLRLAKDLKCSLPAAVGYLHYLWWWALDYAPDGLVGEDRKDVIAKACHWKADVDRFWRALLDAGFAEKAELPGVLKIHDWDEYAGRLLIQRAANAERQRTWRNKHTNGHVTGDVTVTKRVTNTATGPDQPDQPNQPDRTVSPSVGPATRARARGSTEFQSLADLMVPDEVRSRLSQPPIAAATNEPTDGRN